MTRGGKSLKKLAEAKNPRARGLLGEIALGRLRTTDVVTTPAAGDGIRLKKRSIRDRSFSDRGCVSSPSAVSTAICEVADLGELCQDGIVKFSDWPSESVNASGRFWTDNK